MFYPFFITQYSEKLISFYDVQKSENTTYRDFLIKSLSIFGVYFPTDHYSEDEIISILENFMEFHRNEIEFKWLFSKEQFKKDSTMKGLGKRMQKVFNIPTTFYKENDE